MKIKGYKFLFIILIILLILIISFLLLIKTTNNNQKDNNNNLINYYTDNYLYIITSTDEIVNIAKYTFNICNEDPCKPTKIIDIEIDNKEEYRNLIYKIKKNKKISIYDNDLTIEEQKIMKEIINKDSISYELSNTKNNENYNQKGYYVQQLDNGKTRLTVAMGTKNSGGYSIKISKVKLSNNELILNIKEEYPPKGAQTTMAITYPIDEIELNQLPTKITVRNIDNNEIYDKIEINDSINNNQNDTKNTKILYQEEYSNYAHGYSYHTTVIFNDGTIYTWNYDVNNKKGIKNQNVNADFILKNGTKLDKTIQKNDLDRIKEYISKLSDNIKMSKKECLGADKGAINTYIYKNDKSIMLYETGDCNQSTKDETAKKILSIINKYL